MTRESAEKIFISPERLLGHLTSVPRPLVFTNGCFDILHRGHVAYLEEAAGLGETLLVALNEDASVARLEKGPGRPLNPLDDRIAVVAALGCVDLVTAFSEDTPLELINRVQPDVLVKGGDWPTDHIVGAREVLASGGSVHSIPFRFDRSTSALVHRIQKLNDRG